MMHALINYLSDELKDMEKKVMKGESLSYTELQCGDTAAHFLKSLLTSEAMMSPDGGSFNSYRGSYSQYDNRSFRNGGSYEDGSYNGSYDEGSYRRRRDSMGRYSSEEGYSRGGENEQFKSQLHELMAQAPSGTIRQELQKISSMAGNM